jgi:hypothetical protein
LSKGKSLRKEPYIGDTTSNKKRPVKDNAVSNVSVWKGSLSKRKQLRNEAYIGDTTTKKKRPVKDKDVGDVSGWKRLHRQNATDSSHEDSRSTDKNVDTIFDAVENFGIANNLVDNKAKEFVDIISFGEVPNLAFIEETESEYCVKQPTRFDAVESFGKLYNLADNKAKEFDVVTSGKLPNLAEKEETESEYCVKQPTLCGNESEHAIQPYSTVKFSNQKIQQKAGQNKKIEDAKSFPTV